MIKFIKYFLFLAIVSSFTISCVPVRKHQDLQDKYRACESEKYKVRGEAQDYLEQIGEMEIELKKFKKQVQLLIADSTRTGMTLRLLTKQYDKINELNNELLEKQRQRNIDNANETGRLLAELQEAQADLQMREDKLRKLERSLETKKENLEEMKSALLQKNRMLGSRNTRLLELEGILHSKDSAVLALKKKVTKALLGFKNDGLTIHQKNGKVYVSLDERLLFKTGSTTVDPKGVAALKKLAKVLESNKDINVQIEGHTDNVPFSGRGEMKDNWDLSVMRATSIVKIILTNGKIDPKRLTASGRGPHLPIDPSNSKEARTKNRRTEIILTPQLDELFQILN